MKPEIFIEDSRSMIDSIESSVRYYCRGTNLVFTHASGSLIFDENGEHYIDFLSAAGSLNYGHNDPNIKEAIIRYLSENGILQSLDFFTSAKSIFLQEFRDTILVPRSLDYKVQFTGPTGSNSVEAAIKLARKVTGRAPIVAFTNAYHGLSLGSLALTGNRSKRAGAGVSLDNIIRLPFDGYISNFDTISYARSLFNDMSSGYDAPAAFILETTQGEGGLNVASAKWLSDISILAKELGALLIVDDIQAGCGRTGTFFSFENMGIIPDIVCLSKSISGSGLPLALNLIRPQFDIWEPGEHNGTFRGNNLAFVGGAAALKYWRNASFEIGIQHRSLIIKGILDKTCQAMSSEASVVGRGMLMGLRFQDGSISEKIRVGLLNSGVLTETCGSSGQVLKIIPALNIPEEILLKGLQKVYDIAQSVDSGN